ncbi:MAG TPA: SIMPL domain-containing protein [Vicinamibacterales bacterium]|nr:SIMPL domain-containing protein [Vicinamibacterales bacterium]
MTAMLLLAAVSGWAQDQSTSIPSIVTSGEAVVRRAPDVAYVTLAVETRAKAPRDAQAQNAAAMAAVQQRVAALGIPKDALRTVGYTIQQQFDYVNGRQVPRDFVARNSLEVRLDGTERTGEVIDAGVQAGATSVSDLRFDLKDRAGAEREALRLAVADARARADAAAAGAGRTVDRVLKIEDNRSVSEPPPRPMYARVASAQVQAPETPVESGAIEIHQHVTLTVAIK